MIISCPECQARYKINPTESNVKTANVKCPGCKHVFEISLGQNEPVVETKKPGKPLILIVDDARFFREMIKDILSDLPAELCDAGDGDEAWQIIDTQRPDLVLLDLNIPGKTGKEIIKALKASPAAETVKVLAMSGVERGEETASEVKMLGATDFVNKSFTPSELEDRVKKIMGL